MPAARRARRGRNVALAILVCTTLTLGGGDMIRILSDRAQLGAAMRRSLFCAMSMMVVLTACSRDHRVRITQPPASDAPYPALIRAVLAPDSVAANQPVVVKISIELGGCVGFYGFAVQSHGDTAFVTPLAVSDVRPGYACPDIISCPEVDCPVEFPFPGAGAVIVAGSRWTGGPTRFVLPVAVGERATPLQRFDMLVADDSTHTGIMGAQLTLCRLDRGGFPSQSDTIAALTTDGSGHARWTSACIADSFGYSVRVRHPLYSGELLEISPAQCGLAERGVLALTRY